MQILERFNYQVIQLNRLNWQDFLRKTNPAVTALMGKMNVAPADRPRAKVAIRRRLLRLRLDPRREQVIAGFVDHYLNRAQLTVSGFSLGVRRAV